MDEPRHNSPRRNGYLNAVLTAIAVLLALHLVDQRGGSGASGPSAALAQEQPDPGASAQALVSASEQRKQMIGELRRIAGRLERIEAKVNAGLTVRVTEMPASKPESKP